MNKRKVEKLFSAVIVGTILGNPLMAVSLTVDTSLDMKSESREALQEPEPIQSINSGFFSEESSTDTSESDNRSIQASVDSAENELTREESVEESATVESTTSISNAELSDFSEESGTESQETEETYSESSEESLSMNEDTDSVKRKELTAKVPTATPVLVSTGEELKNAYNNAAVTAVSFTKDIVITGNVLTERSTSFAIEGNGYKLDLGGSLFKVKLAATATMDIKNISEIKSSSSSTLQGVVHYGDALGTAVSGWEINFTNVRSHEDNVIRIASVPGAQLNLAGEIYWKTRSEMAVIDGVYIAPNAKVTAIKQPTHEDRSFFWFGKTNMTQATSGSRKFEVGENAVANFKMEGTGYLYPVVFAYYTEVRLREGATFNATMPGNAWRSDYYNSSFIAEGKNKINLTSTKKGRAPISFNATGNATQDSYFSVGPQSELYVIGATDKPLFSSDSATDAKRMNVIIDNPKSYDLRNYSSGTTVNASIASANIKTFQIKNSDIGIWKLGSSIDGPSDYLAEAATLTQANGMVSSSTDATLSNYFPTTGLRRISGLNQNPELEIQAVTDADKSVTARVILGYSPDNQGMADDGTINYIPVYAGSGQAKAEITDSLGTKYTNLTTDANGYVKATGTKFQMKDKTVTGIAKRGGRSSVKTASSTVIDITPPDPTGLAGGVSVIGPTATTISGTTEPGAKITLYKNGVLTSSTATADSSGKFSLKLPSIVNDDKLQFIATDSAGLANLADRPSTNSNSGNKNPLTSVSYRDAVFKAGPIVTIGLAATISANDVTIVQGSAFNPLKANNNLSAKDIDGTDITSKITVKSNQVNNQVPGTYEVIYQVTAKNSITITKTITVTVKEKTALGDAVIHAENKRVELNSKFNPMIGVTATDSDNTDITNQVEVITNLVDTTTEGTYYVQYAVTGKNGKEVIKSIAVEVYKPAVPTIIANDITIYVGTVFDPLDYAQATDIDGTPMQVEVGVNEVDTSKEGVYSVIYFAISPIDASYAIKEIAVTVIPKPVEKDAVIIAPEVLELYLGTSFDPKSYATATDGDDTDLTDKLVIASNTVDTETIGEWQVVYKVTGKSGNEVTFTMRVMVIPRPQEVGFMSYPERISFGEIQVSNKEQNLFGVLSEALIVKDIRENKVNPLTVKVQEISPLTVDGVERTLNGHTYLKQDGNKTFITKEQVLVTTKNDSAQEWNVSETWQADGDGIYLSLPVEDQRVGAYQGKYSWSIEDTP
ncbi:hypothetical protein IGI37_003812 [Enterococcus sp. AZ194]|uniref:immunoglobulin-like domain-containing protein n=1 Tax=Enterococcus sp. AZ194 TaxID=2774629 RepID=UPI003F275558